MSETKDANDYEGKDKVEHLRKEVEAELSALTPIGDENNDDGGNSDTSSSGDSTPTTEAQETDPILASITRQCHQKVQALLSRHGFELVDTAHHELQIGLERVILHNPTLRHIVEETHKQLRQERRQERQQEQRQQAKECEPKTTTTTKDDTEEEEEEEEDAKYPLAPPPSADLKHPALTQVLFDLENDMVGYVCKHGPVPNEMDTDIVIRGVVQSVLREARRSIHTVVLDKHLGADLFTALHIVQQIVSDEVARRLHIDLDSGTYAKLYDAFGWSMISWTCAGSNQTRIRDAVAHDEAQRMTTDLQRRQDAQKKQGVGPVIQRDHILKYVKWLLDTHPALRKKTPPD